MAGPKRAADDDAEELSPTASDTGVSAHRVEHDQQEQRTAALDSGQEGSTPGPGRGRPTAAVGPEGPDGGRLDPALTGPDDPTGDRPGRHEEIWPPMPPRPTAARPTADETRSPSGIKAPSGFKLPPDTVAPSGADLSSGPETSPDMSPASANRASASDDSHSGSAASSAGDPDEAGTASSAGKDGQGPLITLRANHRRSPKSRLKSIIAVLVSLAVIAGGGFLIYQKITEYRGADYSGEGQDSITVTVKSGQTVPQMGDELVAQNVVASRNAFIRAAKKEKRSNSIQAGTYQLKTHLPAASAVAILVDPSNIVNNRFTIPEGLRNTKVLEQVSSATGIAPGQLTAATQDASLPIPVYAQGSSEGFLFPDTYSFDPDPTATQVITGMVNRFNQVAAEENLEARAAAMGRTPHEVMVVASIIERETSDKRYAPLVAEVIYNRLAQGMRLQSDATVAYANNIDGRVTTTDAERALNSPYNTYMVDGLPPGPISNPGKAAIEAALAPATGNYLYFVTVNLDTGQTEFAADSAGHDANVKQFQSWCQAHSDRCE